MSLAIVYTRGKHGIEAPLVTIEVHISFGLPSLSIVGLPETAVKESKDRVRGALLNSAFEFPLDRITVNMAPADVPKEGGRFDLAIALGILAASGQIRPDELARLECVGELSLGGELRPVSGVLPVAVQARRAGRTLIVPRDNAAEAALVDGVGIMAATTLLEVCAHLNGQSQLPMEPHQPAMDSLLTLLPDFSDVQGHFQAKRALEVAATGRHNLLMLGSPGTGKSMLAARLPGILPSLTDDEALESAAVASVSDLSLDIKQWRVPPFRAPHHTASAPALVGGGSNPRPGEISLAHNGVLFLDELPEFDRRVLEVLREPLETGGITISRAARRVDFPARFQFIAAMNPCPCGYLGDPSGRCRCTSDQVQRYRGRISGPLLDRIDMHIEVQRVSRELLRDGTPGGEESSATIKARVMAARLRAVERGGAPNAWLTPQQIKQFCRLDDPAYRLLDQAMEKLGLSHRAYHRILKLARSIADLAGADTIDTRHISEAISFRRLDRRITPA
ncbi:MAG: YifB family Mg chelatase-like AAA ATPase [Methylococcaceae bacterium]